MGLAFKMYSGESRGEKFPPIRSTNCMGMPVMLDQAPDMTRIYPEYVSYHYAVLVCPSGAGGSEPLEISGRAPQQQPCRQCARHGNGSQRRRVDRRRYRRTL